jgi:transcription antitermination factor NusG
MNWATVRCTAGRESTLASLLTQRGREVYYPQEKHWRRPARKRKPVLVQVPAIVGYIFMLKSSIGNAEELRAMENFFHFLTMPSGELKLLPDSDIEWMKEHMDRAEKPSQKPLRRFKLFERVRVPEGPFGGMCGVVTGICKRSVWVSGIDFKFPVLFDVNLLEKDDG